MFIFRLIWFRDSGSFGQWIYVNFPVTTIAFNYYCHIFLFSKFSLIHYEARIRKVYTRFASFRLITLGNVNCWVSWLDVECSEMRTPAQLIRANNPFQSSFGQNKYMLHEMQFYGISYFPSIHIGLNAFNTYDKNERNVTTIMNVME